MPTLGRYEILSKIGSGGMGSVYRAHDPKLDRIVALKVIRLDQFSDAAQRQHLVQRFETEARAAARLRHDNIVTVYDFAEDQGEAYLVMEFVDGTDLASRPRQGLTFAEALRILRGAAAALDEAHEKGVIHRDVKPANLLVRRDGTTKLADFGIARMSGASGLTLTGQMMGTSFYMAPEAMDPRKERPIGPATDQFSFAVLAYELLIGHRPFEADSLPGLALRIVQSPPTPVSQTQNSEELNRIFARALAKDPGTRYPSCRTLVAELEAAFRGIAAQPVPLPETRQTEPMRVEASIGNAVPLVDSPMRHDTPATVNLAPPVLSSLDNFPSAIFPSVATNPTMPAAEPESAATKLFDGTENTNPPIREIPVSVAARAAPAAPRDKRLPVAVGAGVILLAIIAYYSFGRSGAAQPSNAPKGPDAKQIVAAKQAAAMVVVPAGDALLGPENAVISLPAFSIDRTEVTNRAYLDFCRSKNARCPAVTDEELDLPVVNVSYDEAAAFAANAGKRLPSANEWEKAARGSDGRNFPWGNQFRPELANLPANAAAAQAAHMDRAGSRPGGASPAGAVNLLGNVWEWVATPAMPDAPHFADLERIFSGIVPPLSKTEPFYQIRGGSYKTAFPPSVLPNVVSAWSAMPARVRRNDIGFRCVKDIQ